MIRYRKNGPIRVTRLQAPEPPFGAASLVEPYGFPRSTMLDLDYQRLIGTSSERADVPVGDLPVQEIPPRGPLLIDATGPAEAVYRRGEECHRALRAEGHSILHLISPSSGIPEIEPSPRSLIALSAWPASPREVEAVAERLFHAGWRWGLVIPALFPATTSLPTLERLAAIAANHRAGFLLGMRFDLDPKARRALAAAYPTDEESYSTLFDQGAEAIAVATERHIAALAVERRLEPAILPLDREDRSNWSAAAVTGLAGYRLFAMREDLELGWEFVRSSRLIASLDKQLVTIAEAASLSIVEGLMPQLLDALEEWLDGGTARLFEEIENRWRLRRDYAR